MALELLKDLIDTIATVFGKDETRRRIQTAASIVVLAEMKQRIFSDGIATDGSAIGQYSTNPFYQNPDDLVGVPSSQVKPLGKNGSATFKNGKKKVTRYLPQGYAELREILGRQAETVDLNLSGSLERDFTIGDNDGNIAVGIINEESIQKMDDNEERFGKEISFPTDDEIEKGNNAASIEIGEIFNEIENSL